MAVASIAAAMLGVPLVILLLGERGMVSMKKGRLAHRDHARLAPVVNLKTPGPQ